MEINGDEVASSVEDQSDQSDSKHSSLSSCSRKKKKYQVISQEVREQFIQKVISKQVTIKEAAREFGIKFSTSKAILQTYKKEGRIGKKKTRQRKPRLLKKVIINEDQGNPGNAAQVQYPSGTPAEVAHTNIGNISLTANFPLIVGNKNRDINHNNNKHTSDAHQGLSINNNNGSNCNTVYSYLTQSHQQQHQPASFLSGMQSFAQQQQFPQLAQSQQQQQLQLLQQQQQRNQQQQQQHSSTTQSLLENQYFNQIYNSQQQHQQQQQQQQQQLLLQHQMLNGGSIQQQQLSSGQQILQSPMLGSELMNNYMFLRFPFQLDPSASAQQQTQQLSQQMQLSSQSQQQSRQTSQQVLSDEKTTTQAAQLINTNNNITASNGTTTSTTITPAGITTTEAILSAPMAFPADTLAEIKQPNSAEPLNSKRTRVNSEALQSGSFKLSNGGGQNTAQQSHSNNTLQGISAVSNLNASSPIFNKATQGNNSSSNNTTAANSSLPLQPSTQLPSDQSPLIPNCNLATNQQSLLSELTDMKLFSQFNTSNKQYTHAFPSSDPLSTGNTATLHIPTQLQTQPSPFSSLSFFSTPFLSAANPTGQPSNSIAFPGTFSQIANPLSSIGGSLNPLNLNAKILGRTEQANSFESTSTANNQMNFSHLANTQRTTAGTAAAGGGGGGGSFEIKNNNTNGNNSNLSPMIYSHKLSQDSMNFSNIFASQMQNISSQQQQQQSTPAAPNFGFPSIDMSQQYPFLFNSTPIISAQTPQTMPSPLFTSIPMQKNSII